MFKSFIIRYLHLICAIILFPSVASADDFSLGIYNSLSITPYRTKNVKRIDYSVYPLVNYDNDIVYIDGNEAGYYLLNDDDNELKLSAYYDNSSYDSSDGRSKMLRRLNDRHSTVLAGMSYQRTTPIGAIHTQLSADILNNSKGVVGNLAYIYMWQKQGLTLVPELGIDWENAQQHRYYYGVTEKEARRTEGAKIYRPTSGITPYISFTTDYAFTKNWESYINTRIDILPTTIRNSPMVNKHAIYTFAFGIKYNF